MKTPVHTASLRRTAGRIISTLLLLCTACAGKETAEDDTFENPVVLKYENTSIYFHEGTYYYVTNSNGNLELYAGADPTRLEQSTPSTVCHVRAEYGLLHIWHPQIVNIRGKWYIYLSADDGNTGNHQIYVLENPEQAPAKVEAMAKAYEAWAKRCMVEPYPGQFKKKRQ